MKAHIAVLGGDGIGPEVVAEGLRCLEAIGSSFGHEFSLTQLPFGGAAIDACGDPLPSSTLQPCLAADALEAAVSQALEGGARTPDIATKSERVLSTREMGDAVLGALKRG